MPTTRSTAVSTDQGGSKMASVTRIQQRKAQPESGRIEGPPVDNIPASVDEVGISGKGLLTLGCDVSTQTHALAEGAADPQGHDDSTPVSTTGGGQLSSNAPVILPNMANSTTHVLGCDVPAGNTTGGATNVDSLTMAEDIGEAATCGALLPSVLLQQKEIEIAALLKKKYTLRGEIIALKKAIGLNDNENPIVVEDLTVDDKIEVENVQLKLLEFFGDGPQSITVMEEKLHSALSHFKGNYFDQRSVSSKRCFKEFLEGQHDHEGNSHVAGMNHLKREVEWIGGMIKESTELNLLLQGYRKKLCHALRQHRKD